MLTLLKLYIRINIPMYQSNGRLSKHLTVFFGMGGYVNWYLFFSVEYLGEQTLYMYIKILGLSLKFLIKYFWYRDSFGG